MLSTLSTLPSYRVVFRLILNFKVQAPTVFVFRFFYGQFTKEDIFLWTPKFSNTTDWLISNYPLKFVLIWITLTVDLGRDSFRIWSVCATIFKVINCCCADHSIIIFVHNIFDCSLVRILLDYWLSRLEQKGVHKSYSNNWPNLEGSWVSCLCKICRHFSQK